MMLPEIVRDEIRDRLWSLAREISWSDLQDVEKARYYEAWTRDPTIGGILGHYMDPRKVRVYIKDSLLKPYERKRLSLTDDDVLRLLNVPPIIEVSEQFIKPHGRRLSDGRVVCWGKSRDWKLILMAVFERAELVACARPFAAVLFESGKTVDESARALVRDAASRLLIERIEWIE